MQLLRHNIYFLEQLFLQSSRIFFVELLFQNSHFFAAIFFSIATFSEQNLSWAATSYSPEQRIGNSVPQLLFRAATFLEEKLFRIKISTEGLLIWSSYFSKGSTFSEELHFEKANFPEKAILPITYFFWRTTFLEWLLTFSKGVTFYSSYFFRRATFSQHTLSEKLLFHGYAFFPQLYFLFIS